MTSEDVRRALVALWVVRDNENTDLTPLGWFLALSAIWLFALFVAAMPWL